VVEIVGGHGAYEHELAKPIKGIHRDRRSIMAPNIYRSRRLCGVGKRRHRRKGAVNRSTDEKMRYA
jgi:hypothetical protein